MDLESGSLAWLTRHVNSAAVRFYDAITDRQPQSQATSLLGGEKRLEDPWQDFSVNTDPGIGYADRHLIRAVDCRCDRQRSTVWHRIDGI